MCPWAICFKGRISRRSWCFSVNLHQFPNVLGSVASVSGAKSAEDELAKAAEATALAETVALAQQRRVMVRVQLMFGR